MGYQTIVRQIVEALETNRPIEPCAGDHSEEVISALFEVVQRQQVALNRLLARQSAQDDPGRG